MRSDGLIMTVRTYAADFGRVAYLGLCVVIAATLVLERVAPGVAANEVAPQRLAAFAVLCGLLSLVAPEPAWRASWREPLYVATALVATVFAFTAAMAHFHGLPAAFAAAYCVALPFLAYARFEAER